MTTPILQNYTEMNFEPTRTIEAENTKKKELVEKIYYVLSNQLELQTTSYLIAKNPFYLKKPNISLIKYIQRIVIYSDISDSTFILATQYLYQHALINQSSHLPKVTLANKDPLYPNIYNIHQLFLIAVRVAMKFNEDKICDDEYYAAIGGIPLPTLNNLEKIFCLHLKTKLFISPSEYFEFETNFHRGNFHQDHNYFPLLSTSSVCRRLQTTRLNQPAYDNA